MSNNDLLELKLTNRNLDKNEYISKLQDCLKEELKEYNFNDVDDREIDSFKMCCKEFYKNIKNYNKDLSYEFLQTLRKSIIIDGKDVDEIYRECKDKYNLRGLVQVKKELLILYYYMYTTIFNKKVPINIEKYMYEIEFLERSYIRIKCIKNGWSQGSIEKMLNRYYKIDQDYTKEDINLYYFCVCFLLNNFKIVKKELSKGRPHLDELSKKILNRYTIEKGSKRIKQVLQRIKEVDNLFTFEEISKLKYMVERSDEKEEIKEDLMKKLSILIKNE